MARGTIALALVLGAAAQGCGSSSHRADAAADTAVSGDASPSDSGASDSSTARQECHPVTPGTTSLLSVEFAPVLSSADVFLLVDVTASMQEEMDRVRTTLSSTIIPGIAAVIPDVAIAVGSFADFPVEPYGDLGAGDVPLAIHQTMTTSPSEAQAGVGLLDLGNGRDEPESLTEALYLSITGEGFPPSVTPAVCPRGAVGHPCFRPGSVPIYVVITDAPTHEGPDGSYAYAGVAPTPHDFTTTMGALSEAGARVISLDSGDGGSAGDLAAIARATFSLDRSGSPLVYPIGRDGNLLDSTLVSAIETLATETTMRVALVYEDADEDGEDAARWFGDARLDSVEPADAMLRAEGAIVDIVPGARMSYALTIDAPPTLPPLTQRVLITLREQAGSTVAAVELSLPDAETGCP